MLTPKVGLFLNVPQYEMYEEGFIKERSASELKFGVYVPRRNPDGTITDRLRPSNAATYGGAYGAAYESAVIRMESVGMFLEPSGERSDIDDIELGVNLGASDFVAGTATVTSILEETSIPGGGGLKMLEIKKPTASPTLPALTVPPHMGTSFEPMPGSTTAREAWRWILKTISPFYENESFTVHVQPFGTYTEGGGGILIAFCFGYHHYVEVLANGRIEYWYNVNESMTAPSWQFVKTLGIGLGLGKWVGSFSLSITPLGIDAIRIKASGTEPEDPVPTYGDAKSESSDSVVHLNLVRRTKCPFNAALNDYTKTISAPLFIAFPKDNVSASFYVHRSRFATAPNVILAPDNLGMPRTNAPSFVGVGTPLAGGSIITGSFFDDLGNAYTAGSDLTISPHFSVTPGTVATRGYLYTPVLTKVATKIEPRVILNDPEASLDWSHIWRNISFTLTVRPTTTVMDVELIRTFDYFNLLKLDSQVLLMIGGTDSEDIVWAGYVELNKPAIKGKFTQEPYGVSIDRENMATPSIDGGFQCMERLWSILENTPGEHFAFLRPGSVAQALINVLKHCGIREEDIEVVDTELYDMDFDESDEENHSRNPSSGTTMAEIARSIIQRYAIQGQEGIRLTQRAGMYRIALAPYYSGLENPTKVLLLNSSLLPDSEDGWTDQQRFDGINGVQYYIANAESIDITVERPKGNSLWAYAPTSKSPTSDLFACYVAPDTRAIFDPSFWDYEGRVRTWRLNTEQSAEVGDIMELARFARKEYDRDGTPRIAMDITGEWQRGIWPDDIFWIQGQAILKDDTGQIDAEKGEKISFGAWRIEEINVTLDTDDYEIDEENPENMRGTRTYWWTGHYTLVYVGVAKTDEIPMFTTVLPEYGNEEEPEVL